jgi:alkylated DNA repair protein (DNA oxidative demethylase)
VIRASLLDGSEATAGFRHWPRLLDEREQSMLLHQIRAVLEAAPLYRPSMPRSGAPLSVLMSNAGRLGWVADRAGYRYQPTHPETARAWPPMPPLALALWRRLADYPAPPEACLVNYYAGTARIGLHQDLDEQALDAPVLSISLGDSAIFRLGGKERRGATRPIRLDSGDVLLLAGESRMAFHGVDRLLPGTSALLPEGGRFNLTLRRVTPA